MDKTFIKNIIINNLSLGLQFGSRWFLSITLLSTLGVSAFGVFSFIYSLANILVSVLPFGSQFYLIKEVGDNSKSREELGKSISFLLFLSFLVLMIMIVLHILYSAYFSVLVYVGLLLGMVFSFNTILFSYLKGVGDFGFELKINVVFALLNFGLIGYLFLDNSLSIITILWLLILFNLISTVFAIRYSKYFSFQKIRENLNFSLQSLKEIFNRRKYFGLQDIVTASFVQGGMLVLPLLILDDVYGMYRGLLLITAPFSLLNVAFAQVLLNQIKNKSIGQLSKIFHGLQRIAIPVLVLILMCMFYYRDFFLLKISKQPLTETTSIAFVGLCLLILSSFAYSGYEMLLVALEKQRYRFYVMIIGAIVNLIAIFVLLPQYGLVGAVSTNVISSLIVCIVISIVGERELKKQNSVS